MMNLLPRCIVIVVLSISQTWAQVPAECQGVSISQADAAASLSFIIIQVFNSVDSNNDGKLTQAEAEAAFCPGGCSTDMMSIITASQTGADTNSDGGVDLTELEDYYKNVLSDSSDPTFDAYFEIIFNYLDINGDGELNAADNDGWRLLDMLCGSKSSIYDIIFPRWRTSSTSRCTRAALDYIPVFDCNQSASMFTLSVSLEEMLYVIKIGVPAIELD